VNVNVPVCVAAYCETGDVKQSNENTSGDATASNENATWQSNDQLQIGAGGDASTGDATTGGHGCCGSGGDATSGDAYGGDVDQSQQASNSNETSQNATATSEAKQIAPVNVNVPVCVARSCSSGDVSQSNENTSGDATASNENATWQSSDQLQIGTGGHASTGDATTGGKGGEATSGDAYGGDVDQSQTASNSNTTTQNAEAVSEAKQILPVNVNAPICIAKHCETGDVKQSNDNRSGDATASNESTTKQSNDQFQKGTGGDASTGDAKGGDSCCKHGGYDEPKPGCGDSHVKSRCDHPSPWKPKWKRYECEKPKPKPHECERHARGDDARSGDATGGDVHQAQDAWNGNRTDQTASAHSVAEQAKALNIAFAWKPSKRSPDSCRVC
jgi:hypothetical protein